MSNQYQQWFDQRAARNQVNYTPASEWVFSIDAIDQHGEPVSYSVRMGGSSYGTTFTQALRRFYAAFPGSRVQSATGAR